MRKALSYLAAVVMSLSASGAWAADRGVVGLEWGFGPTVRSLSSGKLEQNANIYWKLSDEMTIGVFGGSGSWAMSKKQLDQQSTTHTLRKEGNFQVSGVRFLKQLPMMNMVSAGIDLGVMQFTQNSTAITTNTLKLSDGTPVVPGTFGVPVAFTGTGGLLGLTSRMNLLHAEGKTISTAFVLMASLRYVALPPIAALGTVMDVQTGNGGIGSDPIGPVRNYHNLAITLGANIWF